MNWMMHWLMLSVVNVLEFVLAVVTVMMMRMMMNKTVMMRMLCCCAVGWRRCVASFFSLVRTGVRRRCTAKGDWGFWLQDREQGRCPHRQLMGMLGGLVGAEARLFSSVTQMLWLSCFLGWFRRFRASATLLRPSSMLPEIACQMLPSFPTSSSSFSVRQPRLSFRLPCSRLSMLPRPLLLRCRHCHCRCLPLFAIVASIPSCGCCAVVASAGVITS